MTERNVNDLIRIGDAIAVLCRKTCHPGPFCPDAYCDEMWDKFDGVERIAPEPHWIPCSEKLPEQDTEVLVTRRFLGIRHVLPPKTYVETASLIGSVWTSMSDEYKIAPSKHADPVAWMPLPDPYKEGE